MYIDSNLHLAAVTMLAPFMCVCVFRIKDLQRLKTLLMK